MDLREHLKDKKRIVIKIGSSSLTHPETGALNLTKMEVLISVMCSKLPVPLVETCRNTYW